MIFQWLQDKERETVKQLKGKLSTKKIVILKAKEKKSKSRQGYVLSKV